MLMICHGITVIGPCPTSYVDRANNIGQLDENVMRPTDYTKHQTIKEGPHDEFLGIRDVSGA